jgi:diaminopimelate decarboxylase
VKQESSNLDKQLFTASISSPNQTILPSSARVVDGELWLGDFSVRSLVEQYGSPLYLLDEMHLRWGCQSFVDAMQSEYPAPSRVLFATKSLCTRAVCAIVREEGLGLDVVSEGELVTALNSGAPGEDIYLHGNNKSRSELTRAIRAGCTIILDNWYELSVIREIVAEFPGIVARVMPRLSPEVESHTYDEVRTGQLDSKFGFCLSDAERLFSELAQDKSVEFVGIHAHLGSQLLTLAPFREGARVMVGWYARARAASPSVRQLNIGGGLGVSYVSEDQPPTVAEYARVVSAEVVAACRSAGVELPELLLEPGRAIAAPAMMTAYTVGSIKDIPDVRRYVAVDGGMSDNPRPVTYKSRHSVYHATAVLEVKRELMTIAGRHCESGDILVKDVMLPPISSGDIIVIATTGAYNYSQSSNYNRTPRPAMVLVAENLSEVIVRREEVEDLLANDAVPERLKSAR